MRLSVDEKREIGSDIKTVQFGWPCWPIAMPLTDHIEGDIWEVRTRLSTRIARVLFVIEGTSVVLVHGFIKKTQKTPAAELDVARQRLKRMRGRG